MINKDNYFSEENNMKYTGSSQIKDFLKCESYALAKLNGEWVDEPSKALAISSLVDAIISDEESEFLAKEKEKLNSFIFLKSGKLSSDALLAYDVVEQAKNDPMFMKYLNGEHQVIMTGEINGVPVKIKIDSYFKDKCIVDLKCMATLKPKWSEKNHKKMNFCDEYRYTLQAALYQEIVFQNTGKKLPFIIAAMTKEKYSQRALLQINQEIIDDELVFLKDFLPKIQAIKQGKNKPQKCNFCEWCISQQKTNKIWRYTDYFEKNYSE